MTTTNDPTVTVIYGGISGEHDTNLSSAGLVVTSLLRNNYETRAVKICKDGRWRCSESTIPSLETGYGTVEIESEYLGEPHPLSDGVKYIEENADLCFLAIPGRYGEDGRLQSLLDFLNIPYTFSGVLPSAKAMHKPTTYTLLQELDVKIPPYTTVSTYSQANLDFPIVAKPTNEGASINVAYLEDGDDLRSYMRQQDQTVLLQEYITGKELTCGVLEDDHPQPLPPTQFSFSSKIFSETTKDKHQFGAQTPANISEVMKTSVKQLALKIHKGLGCKGASRSDFVLNDDNLYFLEINTIPGITEKSALPEGARAAGYSYDEMIDCLVRQAHGREEAEL